jgi:hypothetical protein
VWNGVVPSGASSGSAFHRRRGSLIIDWDAALGRAAMLGSRAPLSGLRTYALRCACGERGDRGTPGSCPEGRLTLQKSSSSQTHLFLLREGRAEEGRLERDDRSRMYGEKMKGASGMLEAASFTRTAETA